MRTIALGDDALQQFVERDRQRQHGQRIGELAAQRLKAPQ